MDLSDTNTPDLKDESATKMVEDKVA
jgi:hypothetical protein